MSAISRRSLLQGTAAAGATLIAGNLWRWDAQAQTAGGSAELKPAFDKLDQYIAKRMPELNAPGMTLVVADRSGPLRISTYGFADTKLRRPVAPDTLYEIGSISKSFCGLAILQLRDEGKLDLHKPVREYLPWLEIDSRFDPITVHHLLTHTSGMPGDAPMFPRAPYGGKLWTGYAPGTQWNYCNLGYRLLGLIVQKLDGRPFAQAVRARLFERLGMTSSEPVITMDIRPRLATSYVGYFEDRPLMSDRKFAEAGGLIFTEASGSIASTPGDMGKYIQMILNGGQIANGRLISEDSFRQFLTPFAKAAEFGPDTSYGYGLAIDQIEGRKIARHTGGMVSFVSSIHMDVTDGVGAFASVNARMNEYRPNEFARYALELARAAKAGKPLPDRAPFMPEKILKTPADYPGTYTTIDGKKLVISATAERVYWSRDNAQVALLPFGPDVFLPDDPVLAKYIIRFGRDDKKQIVEAFYGPDWFLGSKYSGPREFKFPEEWRAYPGHYRNDSIWIGSARVFLNKGQLWLENTDQLYPLGGALFRPAAEEWVPERVSFDGIADGRALRMNLSGVDFDRMGAP